MITVYAANALLNTLLGTKYTSPINSAYLALSSTKPEPTQTGTFASGTRYTNWNVTEPSGNGYKRTLVHRSSSSTNEGYMATASDGSITNSGEIHFNVATGDWGPLTYACIFTAATGGNLLAFGQLGKFDDDGNWNAEALAPTKDTVVIIPENSLRFTMD